MLAKTLLTPQGRSASSALHADHIYLYFSTPYHHFVKRPPIYFWESEFYSSMQITLWWTW